MKIKELRFKWKVFAYLLGFCALLLAVLWTFQIIFLDYFYRSVKLSETRRSAAEVINNLDNENLGDIVKEISDDNDISIDITDLFGRSIFRSSPFSFQDYRLRMENAALISLAQNNDSEIYDFLMFQSGQDRVNIMLGRFIPVQQLIYVKIAQNSSNDQFAVIIRSVISPVSATVMTLRYQLYAVSVLMIFLAVILAIIIAKYVSKPIEEISQSAAKLARGDLSVQFKGKGFYEIVELSDTLNTAAFELGKVERLRRELMANVSHDLRTPLSLIYSNAEMMHDFPDEITPQQTQIIMDETQRLATLVNDMLDISKMENEIENLKITNFNLTQNILETSERMNKLLAGEGCLSSEGGLAKKGFNIIFNYDDEVFVNADRTKIDRAFYNLLINAVNYSAENPEIVIEQKKTESSVRISVTDRGEGIAEEELPFIWDRYYKSSKTHKRAVTGTGLGLSIVKKIIELHGGRYGVESQLGKGSVFWFEIGIEIEE